MGENEEFGLERQDNSFDKTFHNILMHIMNSFGEEEKFNFVQYKAAYLLYDIIKEKPFVKGNQRIASMLFLYYLRVSNVNFVHLSPLVLAVLTIFISNSKSSQKETVIKLIINLIC